MQINPATEEVPALIAVRDYNRLRMEIARNSGNHTYKRVCSRYGFKGSKQRVLEQLGEFILYTYGVDLGGM